MFFAGSAIFLRSSRGWIQQPGARLLLFRTVKTEIMVITDTGFPENAEIDFRRCSRIEIGIRHGFSRHFQLMDHILFPAEFHQIHTVAVHGDIVRTAQICHIDSSGQSACTDCGEHISDEPVLLFLRKSDNPARHGIADFGQKEHGKVCVPLRIISPKHTESRGKHQLLAVDIRIVDALIRLQRNADSVGHRSRDLRAPYIRAQEGNPVFRIAGTEGIEPVPHGNTGSRNHLIRTVIHRIFGVDAPDSEEQMVDQQGDEHKECDHEQSKSETSAVLEELFADWSCD